MRRITALMVVGVIVVAACGSSGGGASKPYVDSLVASKDAFGGKAKFDVTDAEKRCLAQGMIDAIGVDALTKAGLTPANVGDAGAFKKVGPKLTRGQAEAVAAAIFDKGCVDMTTVLSKQLGAGSPFAKLSKAKATCLFDAMFKLKVFRDSIVDSILGKSSAGNPFANDTSALFTLLGKCKINSSELQSG